MTQSSQVNLGSAMSSSVRSYANRRQAHDDRARWRHSARIAVLGLLFATVCMTWGTTWIAIDLAVASVPPLMSAGLRFLVAFPLFLGFAFIRKEPLLFPRGEAPFFIFVLIGYFTVPYFLINFGEQYVSAGLTALMFSCMPIFMMLFSTALGNEAPARNQILGTFIGLASLGGILLTEGEGFGHRGWFGVAAILCAALLHGLTYALWKRNQAAVSVITLNVLPVGIAGAALCLCSLLVESPRLAQFEPVSLWALLYLGLVASVGGFIAYFHLLRHVSVAVGGFVFVVFPVVALVIDHLMLGIRFDTAFILLTAIMLFGFALTRVPEGILRRAWGRGVRA